VLEGDLVEGRNYQLYFRAQGYGTYESDFQTLRKSSEPGEIGYEFENIETDLIGEEIPGLKFYADVSLDPSNTIYYKFDILETYKFRTAYDEIFVIRNGVMSDLPADSLNQVCYITERNPGIYLLSGKNLGDIELERFPLHFVSNRQPHLLLGYSMELRIMTLSEEAYNYWNNQKNVLEESGGLFETQPPSNITNIYNIDDNEEQVLGFFGVSSVSSSRIFIQERILDEYEVLPYCEPTPVDGNYLTRLFRFGKGVAYFVFMPDSQGVPRYHVIIRSCFDCTVFKGSTTEIPDFWE
jgi:hypothetical protein